MATPDPDRKSRLLQHAFMLSTVSLFMFGCATTKAPRPAAARVEIQEEVGFTITEDARIGSDVRFEYERALAYLQQGRHEEGIALLESVVEASPSLTAPRIDLGIAYNHTGALDAAESNLLMALELNSDHPIAHNELGIVYRKSGRFDDAKKSYEAALAIYPGYHYARRNLAVLCDLYLADLKCALENYEAYMATVPSDREATMWIADIRNRIGQ